MMTDTCGPMSPTPFAYYDPDTCSVRTSQGTFPWDSTPSSPTLPGWGSMRGGELFELPTPVRLTAARASSSLPMIGTPQAGLGEGGGKRSPAFRGNSAPTVQELIELLPTLLVNAATGAGHQGRDGGANLQTAVSLLPTPAVNDMGRGKTVEDWDEWTDRMRAEHGNGNGHGKSLEIEALRLLPTPTAADNRDGIHVRQMTVDAMKRGASKGANLNHIFENEEVARFHLDPTRQPSPDGNTSSDATLPLPLNLDATTDHD